MTLGCDPWSECLGGDVVNLNRHSLRLPAQLSRLSETWPLAPALRQNNNTMSRRLIEVVDDSLFTWTAEPTFSALLSACSSGSFFALKPFPTFPFPHHPWTSDFFVYLPCSPPRSTPSLPLLTPPRYQSCQLEFTASLGGVHIWISFCRWSHPAFHPCALAGIKRH